MLIGICIEKGLIQGVETRIRDYFSSYLLNDQDKRKLYITIYHLLTMTSGFDWSEFGEWNYWSPMEFSNNIIKSALERKYQWWLSDFSLDHVEKQFYFALGLYGQFIIVVPEYEMVVVFLAKIIAVR